MKKSIIILFLLASSVLFAQKNSGLGFNYQAVIRGADGFVIPSKDVELRFSLMPGQHATTASWIENHKVKTDAFGTIGVTVGKGSKEGGVAANFSDINFAAVYYWLKMEIKENGNYRQVSYTQLTSVPYAEVATNAISTPVGSVMVFAGDTTKIPSGWMLCDGRAISRSEYTNLYNAIGTAWGYGNNSSTFNIPDMRGMFLRGVSYNSNVDSNAVDRLPLKNGGNSGNKVGSYQGDAIRNITGTISSGGGYSGISRIIASGAFSLSNGAFTKDADGGSVVSSTITLNASRTVPVGKDNRPKNVYVNYIIKY